MCYWDLIDNMSLSELFDFLENRNSYKDNATYYEDLVAEAEFRYECEKEEAQLKYLEEKENK